MRIASTEYYSSSFRANVMRTPIETLRLAISIAADQTYAGVADKTFAEEVLYQLRMHGMTLKPFVESRET